MDYKKINDGIEKVFTNTKKSYTNRFKQASDKLYEAAEGFYKNNKINENELKDLATSYNSRFLEYVDNVKQNKKKNLISSKPKDYGNEATLENVLETLENKKSTDDKDSNKIKYVNEHVEGVNKALQYTIQGNEIAEVWFILKNEKKYADKIKKANEKISEIKKKRGLYEDEKKDVQEQIEKIYNQYFENNKSKNTGKTAYIDELKKQKNNIDDILNDESKNTGNGETIEFLGLKQIGDAIKNFYNSAKQSIKHYFSSKEERDEPITYIVDRSGKQTPVFEGDLCNLKESNKPDQTLSDYFTGSINKAKRGFNKGFNSARDLGSRLKDLFSNKASYESDDKNKDKNNYSSGKWKSRTKTGIVFTLLASAALAANIGLSNYMADSDNGGDEKKPYKDVVSASEAPDSIKSFPIFTKEDDVKPPVDKLKKNPHKIKEANDVGKLWFSMVDENRQDKSSITPGYNNNLIPDELEGKMAFYHNDGSGWQKVDKPGEQNLDTGQLILGYVKDGDLHSKASLVVDDYVAPEPESEEDKDNDNEEDKDPLGNGDNNPEVLTKYFMG